MRTFVDANVLFTAAYSPQGKVAMLMESASFLIVTSDYAVEEARRNILAKRPASIDLLGRILEKIKEADYDDSADGERHGRSIPANVFEIRLAPNGTEGAAKCLLDRICFGGRIIIKRKRTAPRGSLV